MLTVFHFDIQGGENLNRVRIHTRVQSPGVDERGETHKRRERPFNSSIYGVCVCVSVELEKKGPGPIFKGWRI